MVDEQPLRRRWIPNDEAALRTAFDEGLLQERNWCELKRQVGHGDKANEELGRDLASLAVDGGTLIVGLDEKKPDDPMYPVPLRQLGERVEQVAATRVHPPLMVDTTSLPSAADPDLGYLIVHVPASPLAPHQVEGVYLGRGDKTKRYLTDAEVERLFQRRKAWASDALAQLDELVKFRAVPPVFGLPQLYIVAQPVGAEPDVLRSVVGTRDWANNLEQLRVKLANDDALNTLLATLFRAYGTTWESIIPQLRERVKIPTGGRLTSGRLTVWRDVEISNDLDVSENGAVWFTVGTVPAPNQNFNGIAYTAVRVSVLAVAVIEFLAAIRVLSESVQYIGPWSFALTLTSLHGTRTIRAEALGNVFGPGLRRGYELAQYTYTARADIVELERALAVVAERLIGAYLRGNEEDDFLDPLLPPPS